MRKLILIILFSLSGVILFADTLIRSDNFKIEGKFLKKNNNYIIFKDKDDVIYYFKHWQVKSLILEKEKEGEKLMQESEFPYQKIIMDKKDELYNGERISIDVKDMDIKDLFLELSKIGNFNVIINESVQGKVSIKLNNVPLYQIIDLLCKQFNIGYEIIMKTKDQGLIIK